MSNKPLAERLQVKTGRTLALVNAPPDVEAILGAGDRRAPVDRADVVLAFTPDRADFEGRVPALLAQARTEAILWLAYPKLTSRLAGDLNRDIIHGLAPGLGLQTVAAVAIDGDWSALRLKRAG